MPHEVPLSVSNPVLVVTYELDTLIPRAERVPCKAKPVIVTLPVLVAEMLEVDISQMAMESVPEPHEVPLNMIEPEFAVTLAPYEEMPWATPCDPSPLMPVIVTQPDPPACTLDDNRLTPAQAVFNPPRPSIVIFPLVVFTFTLEPLMQTPSNEPV